jgi:hypothetical protein
MKLIDPEMVAQVGPDFRREHPLQINGRDHRSRMITKE